LINAELIKYGGREFWKCTHNLIMDMWNSKTMPNDRNIAIFCPIHKIKLECSIYQGISRLNVTYKTSTNILAKYIEPYVEQSSFH